MSVKVLLFGMIASKAGRSEYSLTFKADMTISDIVNEVGCADFKALLLAVNQEQVNDMNIIINDGDEVAIMPPFSGG